MKKEKMFHLYFFSPENNGTWLETFVWTNTKRTAKKLVANKYYVDERMVFCFD